MEQQQGRTHILYCNTLGGTPSCLETEGTRVNVCQNVLSHQVRRGNFPSTLNIALLIALLKFMVICFASWLYKSGCRYDFVFL